MYIYMNIKKSFFIGVLSMMTMISVDSNACSNILVTKGASADGSCMAQILTNFMENSTI